MFFPLFFANGKMFILFFRLFFRRVTFDKFIKIRLLKQLHERQNMLKLHNRLQVSRAKCQENLFLSRVINFAFLRSKCEHIKTNKEINLKNESRPLHCDSSPPIQLAGWTTLNRRPHFIRKLFHYGLAFSAAPHHEAKSSAQKRVLLLFMFLHFSWASQISFLSSSRFCVRVCKHPNEKSLFVNEKIYSGNFQRRKKTKHE